jgi:hypothetical protein
MYGGAVNYRLPFTGVSSAASSISLSSGAGERLVLEAVRFNFLELKET